MLRNPHMRAALDEARRDGRIEASDDIVVERMIAIGPNNMPPPDWAVRVCRRAIAIRANLINETIIDRMFGATIDIWGKWLALFDAAHTLAASEMLNNIRPNKFGAKTVDWAYWLFVASIDGTGPSSLARRLGVTKTAVNRAERILGIRLRRAHGGKRGIDWDTELRQARTDGETQAILAKRLRVSQSAVAQRQATTGISLPRSPQASRGIDWDHVFATAPEGSTFADVARRVGVTPGTVSAAAQLRGITTPIGDASNDPR